MTEPQRGTPVSGDDDVQGHGYKWSDRNVKDEVEPVTWKGEADAPDDTEGHVKRRV